MTFPEAIRTLAGEDYQTLRTDQSAREPPQRKEFSLPPRNQNNRRAFAYLCARGIDPEIITHCMRRGLIYEDAQHHNVVFVGHDEKGAAKYAMLRSTVSNSSFKIEQAGSDKSYGFCMQGRGSTLYVCEAAIDALSVATLRKLEWPRLAAGQLFSAGWCHGIGGKTTAGVGADAPKFIF